MGYLTGKLIGSQSTTLLSTLGPSSNIIENMRYMAKIGFSFWLRGDVDVDVPFVFYFSNALQSCYMPFTVRLYLKQR